MNINLRHMSIIFALLALPISQSLHASQREVQILDNNQLATIVGGWCPFEECEDAPGTGVCQPFPANTPGLCAVSKCSFYDDVEGNVDIYGCTLAGKVTCTASRSYRQCILAFKFSSCSNGPNPLFCGDLAVPTCGLDIRDRVCVCGSEILIQPCDWTECEHD